MKTTVYKGIEHGDHVRCNQCNRVMALPCGADQCPECCGDGTLVWADEEKQEVNVSDLEETEYKDVELKMEDYLSPDTLAFNYPEYYRKIHEEE